MITHLVISNRYEGLDYHLRINTSEIIEKNLVDFPNRIYFFVTQENFGNFLDIQIEFYGILGIEIKEFTLPFVKVVDGKYFYSGISQYVKSFTLLTSTPTPTPKLVVPIAPFVYPSGNIDYGTKGDDRVTLRFYRTGGTAVDEWELEYISNGSTESLDPNTDWGNSIKKTITFFEVTQSFLQEKEWEIYDYTFTIENPHNIPGTFIHYKLKAKNSNGWSSYAYIGDFYEGTPTPTPSPIGQFSPPQNNTPTPTPTLINNEQEPIDDYIYDNMEAVSIKGGFGESSSVTGYNDRTLDTIHGVNGVNGLALENNIVTLTIPGRYYIKARSGAYMSEWTSTAMYFISGDYQAERFESQRRWAHTEGDIAVTESSAVVDITQTTTFKIETYVQKAKSGNGLAYGGGASLFVQKLASVDGGGSSSSGGSSPQSGGIGDLAEVIAQSNFDGILPDRIILTDITNQIVPYTLSYVKSTYIEYAFSADTINTNLHIRFNNDPSGTLKVKTTGHELYTGDVTLQDIIDNDHAVYLGGSSSGSSSSSFGNGITSLDITKDIIPLVGSGVKIPDSILVTDADDSTTMVQLDFLNVNGSYFSYWATWSDASRWQIAFDVTDGSYHDLGGVYDHRVAKEFDSIQEYITAGRAIYLGGSSSSSGGSSSSNGSSSGASNIVTGNYTGDGEDSQTIDLGFRPAMVHVKCTSAPYYSEMTQIDGLEGTSLRSYHTLNNSDDGGKIEITDTGFIATGKVNNSTFNHNESAYYYYAISATSGSSSSSSIDESSIAPTVRKLIENFKQNNLDIELPEGIIVNWDNKDTTLPLMSADKNYIWYGETIGNVVVLKRFKNEKLNDDYGVSDNWGPVGNKEISDWDKSASLKDYIDSNKIK